MGTIKINKNNNETNKDKTKLELFIEKQSALQNNGAALQTAKEIEPTALSAATAVATKGLSNGNQIIINNDGVIEFETDFDAGDIYDTYKDMLKVDWQNYGVEEYWATIFIKSGELNIQPNVKTVQLALTSTEFAYGEFRFNDVVCIAEANKTYLFDIKDLVESKDKVQINLRTASDKSTSIEFITKGENAPKIILTYKEDDNDVNKIPNIKDFNLGDKAKGYVDLNNGTFCAQFAPFNSSDFALPLNVSHIYKKGGEWSKCGQNWRLNLNRMLKVAPNDNKNTTLFTYTDEFGIEYDFEEKYYYLDNGQKVFVTKDSVEIDLNGNLTSLGRTVYRHQICNGMTLVSEINDFIKADVVDQRSEKQINLEETIKQYKNTLCDYVIINIDSGIIIYRNHDVSKEIYKETYLKNLENNPQLTLISENSAIQLSTLLSNKQSLESQISEATDANHKAQLNNQLRTQINPQISSIRRQTTRNVSHVKEMFETYFNKLEELDFVQLNTPVNYLKDANGLISGFNKNGNLVCLCNAYGGYVAVEYNKLDQISSIYDDKGKYMSFEYEDDKLASITDCRGRKTTYVYNEKKLTTVMFADGSSIRFTYSGEDISTVTDSNGNKSTITYANNKLSRIQTLSHMVKIAKDDVTRGASYTKKIADVTFGYTSGGVNINYGEGKSESYTFTSGKNIQSHSQADEIQTKTVTYSYDYSQGKKITEVRQTDVGGEPAVKTIKMYDALDRLMQKVIDWRNISDSVQKRTEYFYFYDNHDNLIGEKCCEFFKKDGNTSSNTSLKTYSYNAQGSLILTESFVMGEELTSGKNYEERVYDENGNVIKTVKWNSLDSSSKFYSESVISESGLVTAEKDETGEAVSEYEYLDGTNVVKSVKQINGSTVAYGRDPGNFTVTSVTQSTADGESNTNDIIYNCDLPVEVKSGNTVIDYEYDFKGRKTKVTVNGKVQSTSTYEDFEYNQADDKYIFGAKNSSIIAADNETITLVENKTGKLNAATNKMRITEETTLNGYEFNRKEYDEKGRVKKVIDNYSDVNLDYTYNHYGNIVSIEKTKNNVMHLTENYRYNEYGEVSEKHIVGAVNHAYTFGYKQNAARTLEYIRYDNNKFKPLTDVNGRNTGKEITLALGKRIAGEYISYRKVGDHATNMPSVIWYASGDDIKDNIKYKYDKSGNICEITENGHIVAQYAYDGLNRLVREDNKPLNKTVVYTYDNCGNITERCEYAYTRKSGEELTELDCTHFAYEYDGDRLVSYNGEKCEYNNNGCPYTYRNKSLEWRFGTRVAYLDGISYEHDGFGKRIKKNNIEFVYDSDGRLIKQSDGLEFVYDDKGVVGIKHNSTQYFYRRDIQGNIIAILDESGAVVVRYIYDAWGNHAVLDVNGNDIEDMSHIGNVNPFRYRGYYYDVETGFYYLKSRYYDPETGRFISQDSIDYADPEAINGLNLYAYCGNNPVMNVDPTGTFFLACLLVGLIVGAIAGAVIGGVQAAEAGYTGWDLVGAIFMGAVIGGAFGAIAGALVGLGGAMIGSGLSAISGAGGLLALAGGGTAAAVAAGGVVSAGLGAVVVGGGLAIAGVGINVLFSKHNPGMSNKPPVSWTDIDEGVKIYNQFGKNSEKATEYLLNNKYGIGNWYKGAKTEFNALKKWFDRIIRLWGKG